MGQVISTCFGYRGVEAKIDEEDNRSLIYHEEGLSYSISVYPDNDTGLQPSFSHPTLFPSIYSHPLLEDSIANLNEKPVVDMPCSESCLDPRIDHKDRGSSSVPFLNQQTETAYEEEIKDVITSEHEPPEQGKEPYGSEARDITKVDYVNDSKIEGAVISKEIMSEERRLGPYTSSQKILLVGEGDFSFSASLAKSFSSATNVVATSLDSREFLSKNYKRALRNISKLIERGGTVLHGVDCTKMEDMFRSMIFDRIIYNFPHTGLFDRDETQLHGHRTLVRLFLANAKNLIKKDGEIHITHKSKGFFLQWDIKSLGSDEGLLLLEEVPFNHKHYPGYRTMCGFGGNNFFYCYPSKTYKFGHPQTL